jgi:HEAT repeat protein
MKALTTGLILLGLVGIGVVGIWAENKQASQEAKESSTASEDFLIQKGPAWIAKGDLKGWVRNKDQVCKTNWWTLRTELIKLGDNEATPILVIFLNDGDPYLRLYAAELLSHIGDKRALKDLREVGENDKNRKVRKRANWAYEQISGEKFNNEEKK